MVFGREEFLSRWQIRAVNAINGFVPRGLGHSGVARLLILTEFEFMRVFEVVLHSEFLKMFTTMSGE